MTDCKEHVHGLVAVDNNGRCDYSAMCFPNTSYADLDDLERQRLRNLLKVNRGEKTLLDYSDEDLDKALGLVRETSQGLIPTVAGLLLIGKEKRLKQLVPGNDFVFQHLSAMDVLANEDMPYPLLKAYEILLDRFRARNSETEIMQGFVRVGIPMYSEEAFREALVNAICHRDYRVLGRISVRFTEYGLEVTSPGGFVSGVTPENILTAESKPRNALLLEIFKRIGLAEKAGRGIERIFEDNMLFGRPWPDYSESTCANVRVSFLKCPPDKTFLRMILQYQKETDRRIPYHTLMVLSVVLLNKQPSMDAIAAATHLPSCRLEQLVEVLVKDGLLIAKDKGSKRKFVLNPARYKPVQREFEFPRE